MKGGPLVETAPMNTILIILIVLFAIATAYALVRGVITMAQGKDVTGVQSNNLMAKRVAFQGIAILLVIILFMLGGRGLSGG